MFLASRKLVKVATNPRSTSAKTPATTSQTAHALDPKKLDFLNALIKEFPDFSWHFGNRFKFKAPKTIEIDENCPYPLPYFALLTLHELGHALSKHKDYNIDVERLKIESEAWQRAKSLIKNHPKWQKTYQISWNEDFAENELDSYRDWLHQKSKCKTCGLTMYQTPDKIYHCPQCDLLKS